jgi:hypothetical protein
MATGGKLKIDLLLQNNGNFTMKSSRNKYTSAGFDRNPPILNPQDYLAGFGLAESQKCEIETDPYGVNNTILKDI